ncbi:thiolase family protein [Arthrobacter bambusae]|uniref:thiolase family protein n=1 Tax=Arthrobacter bambusae TaxID=1338426 RepID=UPI002786E505|nr:thiolase family protein [Arthrobacter bambusae]MDQ0242407.1 acetyl-CoA C-acetyltransferase [Arthrobacter bambusae]
MSSNEKIVILDGARTPIGSFGGVFKDVPGFELGAMAVKAALNRSWVETSEIDEVVVGCIGQVGPDAYNARRVAIAAGLPESAPAYTVNRLCGSGLQAIWSVAMQMRWGGADFAVAGGNESMTQMPFYDFGARNGYKLGDQALVDGTVAILTDPFSGTHMGVTAENVARKYSVSRQEQDEFALESQRRAATHAARAAFAEEITPVHISGRQPLTVETDEHPRPGTTLEALGKLRGIFEAGGTVTAGNASGINDGAAVVVLARESVAAERGLARLVTLEAVATAAMAPGLMGYAPVLALQKLFEQTGTTPADIDTIELNEAFASQAVAVIRAAKLDPEKINPYGGAIALGHPVGATGAILSLRVAKDLARRIWNWASSPCASAAARPSPPSSAGPPNARSWTAPSETALMTGGASALHAMGGLACRAHLVEKPLAQR